jgi:UPF0271 protein
MPRYVDINADLGEGFGIYTLGQDEKIMDFVSSANIACGWHAGDPIIMRNTVKMAKLKNVAVGAHPSYPDRLGFGRRYMKISGEEARNYILYQIGALSAFVKAEGLKLQHVKPHGALYNAMVKDEELTRGIVEALLEFDKTLIFVGPSLSRPLEVAKEMGARVAHEVFADRAYNSDGTLVSRNMKNAVLHNKHEIARRVISMIKDGGIKSVNGEWVELKVDTICIHGDTPEALEIVEHINKRLIEEGIEIKAMGAFIR